MKKLQGHLGVLLALCISAPSFSDDSLPVVSTEDWERREILVDPTETDEKIIDAAVLGEWKDSGFAGTLKYLVAEGRYGTNKLFVQWLDENSEIAYSVSIREFNIQPEYAFALPSCVDKECNSTLINAVHVYEEKEQSFILHLTALGRYKMALAPR